MLRLTACGRKRWGDDFLVVPRLSRIHYDQHYYRYPLHVPSALATMGVAESFRAARSYVQAQVAPIAPANTFEEWVSNRFGRHLYRKFFKTYTEKVWGIPCDVLQADWAAQRIGGLSVWTIIANNLTGADNVKTLIGQFSYPRRGPGMMWERFQEAAMAAGAEFRLREEVLRLEREGQVVTRVTTTTGDYAAGQIISSMPISDLMAAPLPTTAGGGTLRRAGFEASSLHHRLPHRGRTFSVPRQLDIHPLTAGQSRQNPKLRQLEPGHGPRPPDEQLGHGILLRRR